MMCLVGIIDHHKLTTPTVNETSNCLLTRVEVFGA